VLAVIDKRFWKQHPSHQNLPLSILDIIKYIINKTLTLIRRTSSKERQEQLLAPRASFAVKNCLLKK